MFIIIFGVLRVIGAISLLLAGLFAVFCVLYFLLSRGEQRLSFKAFRALYEINPKNWDIDCGSIAIVDRPHYKTREGFYTIYTEIYMQSFIGQLRYFWYTRNIRRREEQKKLYNKRKELTDAWQKDIDAYRERAHKELADMAAERRAVRKKYEGYEGPISCSMCANRLIALEGEDRCQKYHTLCNNIQYYQNFTTKV